VDVREAADEPRGVGRDRKIGGRVYLPFRMPFKEPPHHVIVLLRLE
jgi:hypothetical protein